MRTMTTVISLSIGLGAFIGLLSSPAPARKVQETPEKAEVAKNSTPKAARRTKLTEEVMHEAAKTAAREAVAKSAAEIAEDMETAAAASKDAAKWAETSQKFKQEFIRWLKIAETAPKDIAERALQKAAKCADDSLAATECRGINVLLLATAKADIRLTRKLAVSETLLKSIEEIRQQYGDEAGERYEQWWILRMRKGGPAMLALVDPYIPQEPLREWIGE